MNGVLLPAVPAFVGYSIYGLVDIWFGEPYVSEWMTKDFIALTTVVIVIVNALIVSLLSASLFLNAYDTVRKNLWLSFLSWFLPPMIWIGYLLEKYRQSLTRGYEDWQMESLFILSNTLPYLAGLLISFLRFRKKVRAEAASYQ